MASRFGIRKKFNKQVKKAAAGISSRLGKTIGVLKPELHGLLGNSTRNSGNIKKKKILICLAESGNGHRSVAQALEQAFSQKYGDQVEVKIMDLFYEAGVPPYSDADLVHSLVTRLAIAEKIQRLICRMLDTEFGNMIHDDLWLPRTYRAAKKILDKEQADLLVSVHWLSSEIFQMYFKDNPQQKFAVVLTDLENVIRPWYAVSTDLLVCGTQATVDKALELGVPQSKIMSPFFPLRMQLSEFKDRNQLLRSLNLDPRKPTVLLSFGGLGGLQMRKQISYLLNKVRGGDESVQIIVLTGRVEVLYRDLTTKFGDHEQVRVLGFVDNMQDYLAAVDVIIGKPGANSVLEAMLFQKQMVLTRPIGDQEVGNLEFAQNQGNFHYAGDDPGKMVELTEQILADWTYESAQEKMQQLKQRRDNPDQQPHSEKERRFDEAEMVATELFDLVTD